MADPVVVTPEPVKPPRFPAKVIHVGSGVAIGLVTAVIIALGGMWWNNHTNTEIILPGQRIVGVDKSYPLGELVDLSISSIDQMPAHLESVSYIWKVYEPDMTEKTNYSTSSKGIVFGAGVQPKKMKVDCVVTYLYCVHRTWETRTIFISGYVYIGQPGPNPNPPGPQPNPGPPAPEPEPTFIVGKYDLSKWAYTQAKSSVKEGPLRQKGAQALANSFSGIASSVAAGVLKDPKDLLEKTLASNQKALADAGVSREEWVAFFKALQDHVYDDLWQKKSINSTDDFGVAWNEIAAGLSKLK